MAVLLLYVKRTHTPISIYKKGGVRAWRIFVVVAERSYHF